jgi:hypothetical protein
MNTERVQRYEAFEQRVRNALSRLGSVRSAVASEGQLVDFLVDSVDESGAHQKLAVEAKMYAGKLSPATVDAVSAQFERLRRYKEFDRAAIVALNGFTHGAREAAARNGIELLLLEELEGQGLTRQTDAPASPSESDADRRIFVLMPFQPRFNDVYKLAVQEIASELQLVAERADDIQHNGEIIDVVLKKITDAAVVIADLTGANPNVFYEVGYSHHVKPDRTILMTQNVKRVPFDLRGKNLVAYDSVIGLRPELLKRLKATLEIP